MKKFGFTLAEVLITLGIIGVVSALVIPTFTASTQRAKIGPKLGKAVASFEQAVQAVLNDANSDSISDAQVLCPNSETLSPLTNCFYNELEHHLKGAAGTDNFNTADGIRYSGAVPAISGGSGFAHETQVLNQLTINLNPNANDSIGGNIFYFHLMDDGTLIPWGGSRDNHAWQTECGIAVGSEQPNKRAFCAGHVMENNLRVQYNP